MSKGSVIGPTREHHCLFVDLGLTGVPDADRIMSTASDLRRRDEIPDLLLFMAHPRTVSVGLRDLRTERPKDLLVPPGRLEREGIALARSVRGGGLTYHWPGQVVCYLVMALEPEERDVPVFMHKLEEVGIRTLRNFGVHASRRRDSAAHVGLWLGNRKIVSMGIRIRRWVTSFGFVINVEGEHRESSYVRPCGVEGATLITLQEILGRAPTKAQVMDEVKETFEMVFGRMLRRMPEEVESKICSPTEMGDAHLTGSGR